MDVDFENAGGKTMDEVLVRANLRARVALCGMISQYDQSSAANTWAGQKGIGMVIMSRITMQGFVVTDHVDRFEAAVAELAGFIVTRRLKDSESVVEGLEHAHSALEPLFDGGNDGKLLVRVSEPSAVSTGAH